MKLLGLRTVNTANNHGLLERNFWLLSSFNKSFKHKE